MFRLHMTFPPGLSADQRAVYIAERLREIALSMLVEGAPPWRAVPDKTGRHIGECQIETPEEDHV